MAYKTFIFGTDDAYPTLKPFYDRAVERGTLEIVAYGIIEENEVRLVDAASNPLGGGADNIPIVK